MFLGRDGISGIVLDIENQVLFSKKLAADSKKGTAVLAQLEKLALMLISGAHLDTSQILGVGVSVPGLVDTEQGKAFLASTYGKTGPDQWLDVKSFLEEALDLPVVVDNDSTCFLIAEHLMGAARGFYNTMAVKIGKGVGGALMFDGKVYRGVSSVAGEIGHVTLHPGGRTCRCGAQGCVEAYLGEEAIIRRAKDAIKKHSSSKLKHMGGKDGSNLGPADLGKAARSGDKLARTLLDEIAEDLAHVLVTFVNLINPELIVVGGTTIDGAPSVLEKAEVRAREMAFTRAAAGVSIVTAKLGPDAHELGAALLVSRRLMH